MDLFTKEEVEQAKTILKDRELDKHGRICALLRPVMGRINKATGQDNNLAYMAYLLEYQCVRENLYAQ